MEKALKIPQEEIEQFINGDDPMERIVNLDYKNADNFVSVFYRDEQDRKCIQKEPFYPFVWATHDACLRLCQGDKVQLKKMMNIYHIGVKKLSNVAIDGTVRHEFDNGYMFMFFAKRPMSYYDFTSFFKRCNNPIYTKKDKNGKAINPELENQYLIVNPQEQFLIQTGKRFFKGYYDYDNLLRMIFDLETTGLDTEKDRIVQLGVRINRPFPGRPNGFEKIFTVEGKTEEEKNKSELKVIDVMFRIIYTFKPDIITAHNGENFDWNMIIGACKRLGTSIEEISSKYFNGESVRKKERESILKLGGEIEKFRETIVPYTIVTDSLHAVRRAQAIDSNMQRADLKYSTEYWELKKPNRVYTPGDKISEIWADQTNQYAFNDSDGDWYIYDTENGESVKDREEFGSDDEYKEYIKSIKSKQDDKPFKLKRRNVLLDGYVLTTGRYIIERYLLDDLYECDKVEWKGNSANFLICKMLPIPYKKCTTMGTAGQWRSLMMAWSYKKGLAIPPFKDTPSFTGGLSRLLKTGYVYEVFKADFSSLYPSILLTWGIHDGNDLLNSMLSFLEYFLTTREKYKDEKKKYDKLLEPLNEKILDGTANDEEKRLYQEYSAAYALADGKQLQTKQFCNSNFGALSSNRGSVFPWKSLRCGEQTTCTGRQCLRLMISYLKNLGYDPIVGDSVTGDTPLFIRYKNSGLIDIKPIEEIFDTNRKEIDILGREYDYSEKPYQVLCRSGWKDVEYIYRHSTNKPIYRIEDKDMVVDVTEDHSLFDENKNEIKPNEITEETKLEYYSGDISNKIFINNTDDNIFKIAQDVVNGKIDRIPLSLLNSNIWHKKLFIHLLKSRNFKCNLNKQSKTLVAGIQYICNIE